MTDLALMECRADEGDSSLLSPTQIESMRHQIPGWDLNADQTSISRTFRFSTRQKTMTFVSQVSELGRRVGCPPTMDFGDDYCTLRFTTSTVRGLTQNDFICAAKVNALWTEASKRREVAREVSLEVFEAHAEAVAERMEAEHSSPASFSAASGVESLPVEVESGSVAQISQLESESLKNELKLHREIMDLRRRERKLSGLRAAQSHLAAVTSNLIHLRRGVQSWRQKRREATRRRKWTVAHQPI